MLVLSRKRDEKVVLGLRDVIQRVRHMSDKEYDDLLERGSLEASVCIVDIRGDKVRLGFEFPKEIPVHRQEVYEAIQREHTLASLANVAPEREEQKCAEAVVEQG